MHASSMQRAACSIEHTTRNIQRTRCKHASADGDRRGQYHICRSGVLDARLVPRTRYADKDQQCQCRRQRVRVSRVDRHEPTEEAGGGWGRARTGRTW
jgi:hypothetical protein